MGVAFFVQIFHLRLQCHLICSAFHICRNSTNFMADDKRRYIFFRGHKPISLQLRTDVKYKLLYFETANKATMQGLSVNTAQQTSNVHIFVVLIGP